MRLKFLILLAAFLISVPVLGQGKAEAAGGSLPPWPLIYTGNVTVGGVPATDGMVIVGKIRDYESIPLEVSGGRIVGLAVGPPDVTYFGETITFELRDGERIIVANETDLFTNLIAPTLRKDFHLTFPDFPTPTPVPTATATATPLPTATPVATATPISVGPIVYNGVVVVSGGTMPEDAILTARIGNYESQPVTLDGGRFISLIIDLDEPGFTDKEVTFYLNGVLSRTKAIYHVGETIRNIDLIFMDFPVQEIPVAVAPTPLPTEVPVPTVVPTMAQVSVPATNTPVAVVSTNTPLPTQVPAPTPEPIVLVVTATPEAEELPPAEGQSGGCFAVADIDPLTGAANVLAMIGPLLLLVGYRGYRKLF